MNFTISDKMSGMKPSAIREFFKYAADPAVISMSAGSPAPEALPVDAIRSIMGEIMAEDIEKALVYNISEGFPLLREALKTYLRDTYNSFDPARDDLLVLSGAQQCMDLVCKVLCNEGDVILCEEPSFTGSLNCFRSYGVKLVGVPMQQDGMDIQALEQTLGQYPNARFIYTIPNFQNPTGITMSLAKRKALYELAVRHNIPILEDDPYGDLRFAGDPLPSIKSMDKDGIVFYARTFSKILAAGIRVGYLAAPKDPELFGKLTVAKQCTDVHTNMLSQLLCYRFLTEYDIAKHIGEIGVIYREKCELMLSELDKFPAGSVSFTRPQGGLFVWVDLPNLEDAGEFCMRAVKERKVSIVPGSSFYPTEGLKIPAFRMTFAAPSKEQISKALGELRELIATC